MLNLFFRKANRQVTLSSGKLWLFYKSTLAAPSMKIGHNEWHSYYWIIHHKKNAYLSQQPISPSQNLLSLHQPWMKSQEHLLRVGGQSVLTFLVLGQHRYPSNLKRNRISYSVTRDSSNWCGQSELMSSGR